MAVGGTPFLGGINGTGGQAGQAGQADRPDAELPLGQRAIQSLQSFGWFQEPASTVSH